LAGQIRRGGRQRHIQRQTLGHQSVGEEVAVDDCHRDPNQRDSYQSAQKTGNDYAQQGQESQDQAKSKQT